MTHGTAAVGPQVLFHRFYAGYSGGHGKVWDYFNHALALGYDARIHFAPGSLRESGNPWAAMPERVLDVWRPQEAGLLFVAGMDWQAVPCGLEDRVPVINLLQSGRHADPELPLFRFLGRAARRICVAHEVAKAVVATGQMNGAVRVIPAAVNLPPISAASPRRGVFIDGIKRPALAKALMDRLSGSGGATSAEVTLLLEHRERADYLSAVASAQVAVLLPLPREGFYLPALEAMALGTPVVTLDAVGNREYLQPEGNAFVVDADVDALERAVRTLLEAPDKAAELVRAGYSTASRFSLISERDAFSEVLNETMRHITDGLRG